MEYLEFTKKVRESVERKLGEGYSVSTKKIAKNNGVNLQAVLINSQESAVTPAIYLEAFYERYCMGDSLESITESVCSIYFRSIPLQEPDLDFLNDFEQVKEKLVYRLINTEKNREQLSQVPHIPFLDLSVCFYLIYTHPKIGEGWILVKNSHMEEWNTDTACLLKHAQENTEQLLGVCAVSMNEMIKSMTGGTDDCEEMQSEAHKKGLAQDNDMKVLTNKERSYGAVSLLYPGLLRKMADEASDNLYILPSSVHEVILVSQKDCDDAGMLKEIVREVNAANVLPEEFLSDNVYFYEREQNKVSCL